MSDIPSDIMKTANELNERVYDESYRSGQQYCRPIEIAKAIYEERKRCARIADEEADRLLSNEEEYPAARAHDFLVVARRISKAILSGEMKD